MNPAILILETELRMLEKQREILEKSVGLPATVTLRQCIDEVHTGIAALQCLQSGYLKEPETFTGKIAAAINHHSLENGSDTQDFILAGYLKRCLENFDLTMQTRVAWHGPQKPAEEVVEEKQYRNLEIGEIIESGDDMFAWNTGPWKKALESRVGTNFHHELVPHRRPIVPEKQYRMLKEGETIEVGDEIHPLTVAPAFAESNEWEPLREGTSFIGGAVGSRHCGITLVERGFRRPLKENEVRDAHGNTWVK